MSKAAVIAAKLRVRLATRVKTPQVRAIFLAGVVGGGGFWRDSVIKTRIP